MADLDSALAAQRRAADNFKTTALKVSDSLWNVPRAPGKWSPAQVTDHVGVSTNVSRKAMSDDPGTRGLPRFLRPLLRKLLFDPIVRKGAFPAKSKAPATFAPAHSPLPRPQLIARIDAEIEAAEREVRAKAASGLESFEHPFFGKARLADYVMFNALHFDHHREQLPGA